MSGYGVVVPCSSSSAKSSSFSRILREKDRTSGFREEAIVHRRWLDPLLAGLLTAVGRIRNEARCKMVMSQNVGVENLRIDYVVFRAKHHK